MIIPVDFLNGEVGNFDLITTFFNKSFEEKPDIKWLKVESKNCQYLPKKLPINEI